MDKKPEEQEPQTPPESEETKNTEGESEDKVTLSKAELDDLKHRAEVSSQNYERLKKAESRVQELESASLEDDLTTDEEKEAKVLRSEVSALRKIVEKSEVTEIHPDLKDVWNDFEEYRSNPENAGMSIKTAARAFLAENGETKKRKGLEPVRGGSKSPVKTGMTDQEIASIRANDGQKYRKMLKEGKIKFSS